MNTTRIIRRLFLGIFLSLGFTHFAFSQAGTWAAGAAMPGASYGLSGAFVNGKFYAISGFATNRVGIYNPTNNSWTTGPPLPNDPGFYQLRQYFGCAVVGTKIYVIGGDTGGSGGRDTNYEYDTVANSWATKAPLPGGARYNIAAVNLSGKIYVIGGNDGGGNFFTRVDIYDPSNNTWNTPTSGTPLPANRAGMAAEAINGKIYLAGGYDSVNTLNTALVFDPSNPGSWATIPSMPIYGVGRSVVLNNQFFIIGCGANGAPAATAIQVYDPVSATWSTNYSPLPTGRGDGAIAADQASQKIYYSGGYSAGFLDRLDILSLSSGPPVITSPLNLDFLSTNEVFDPVSNTWVTKARMPTAREGFGITSASGGQDGNWIVGASMPHPAYGSGAAFVNGKFYVISGFVPGGNYDVRIYDPATGLWTFGAPLPADPYLRHFFGCAVAGTKIYVIGGDTGGLGARDTNYEYDTVANSWATKAPLPGGARSFLAATNLNGKIYAIGGIYDSPSVSTSRVDIYDPSNNTWSSGTALPAARTGLTAATINGKIYLAGGNDTSGTLTSALVFDPNNPGSWTPIPPMPIASVDVASGTALGGKFFIVGTGPTYVEAKIVEAYDPVSNTWSTNYSLLPTGREDGAAAGDDASGTIYYTGGYNNVSQYIGELDILSIGPASEKIYVAGGKVAACPSSPVATLEAYNPNADSWVTLGPMPTARANLGAANVNGVVYFVGGQTGCAGAVGNVEAYNVATKSWVGRQPMIFPRNSTGIGVINNKIYVVGGDDGNGVPQGKLEVYDPAADLWSSLADMPTARFAPVVGVVGNVLYAIGGYDDVAPDGLTTVEAFDPGTGNWTTKQSMVTPRTFGAAAGVINNKIYVFGGVNSSHEVSTDEVYDPSTDSWTVAPPMLTARFGLGGAIANNKIHAVGGLLNGIATVGRQFTYQITATNHPTSYAASNLPSGLTIDASLGLITGKPTTPSFNNQVQISATNAAGTGSATLAFSVQDTPPAGPVIVNSTSATARKNQATTFQVLAKNANPSAIFTAGGLPPNMSIDSATGLISGSPTANGNFAVSVSVSDGAQTANTNVQLTVISDSSVPILTSKDTAVAVPGQPFSHTLSADVAGRFDVVASTLPPDLTLNNTTGVISGIFRGISVTPGAIKKEPPAAIIQPLSANSNGVGTAPLNIYVPGVAAMNKYTDGHVRLTFSSAPNKFHNVQASSDPSFSNPTTIAAGVQADINGKIQVDDPNPGETRFYRLRYDPSAPGN
ncbi:MAG: putative Ig domain-containing protein [Verrucomicrobiota bacterium]|nr:putative Ig domain-containing protein [Verrucomicrobiota bacterium]